MPLWHPGRPHRSVPIITQNWVKVLGPKIVVHLVMMPPHYVVVANGDSFYAGLARKDGNMAGMLAGSSRERTHVLCEGKTQHPERHTILTRTPSQVSEASFREWREGVWVVAGHGLWQKRFHERSR